MPDAVTIYHNPRCSKSRLTLKLLRRLCDDVHVVKYLEEGIPEAVLLKGLKQFGRVDMLRRGEDDYRQHVYKQEKTIQDAALVALMQQYPSIIQRPLVVTADGRVAIGRPPEKVEALLTQNTPATPAKK